MADPVTLSLFAGATLLSAKQTMDAGAIAQMEAETEATQVETAAASREADRKAALADAAASQMAEAGAKGIKFQGSPLSILDEDIRREEEAGQRDIFQSQLGASAARARGSVERRLATGKAITGMLTTGAEAAAI